MKQPELAPKNETDAREHELFCTGNGPSAPTTDREVIELINGLSTDPVETGAIRGLYECSRARGYDIVPAYERTLLIRLDLYHGGKGDPDAERARMGLPPLPAPEK